MTAPRLNSTPAPSLSARRSTDPTNGNQTINVPAGPFLKVVLNNAALQFGGTGGPSISGSFAFDQSTEAGFGSPVATAGGAGSGPTIPNVSAADVTSVAVADVNGDGFPDIVLGISGRPDQLWLNAGKDSSGNWLGFTQAPSGTNGLFTATTGVTAVSLTDVNNDGLPDLIVSTGGSGGTTSIYLNRASRPRRSPPRCCRARARCRSPRPRALSRAGRSASEARRSPTRR